MSNTIELPATVLHRAIGTVLPGRQKKGTRPALSALHLQVRDGCVELTTTETHLLHRLTLTAEVKSDPFGVLLNGDWLEQWLKVKPPTVPAVSVLTVADGLAIIECFGNVSKSTVADVDYPRTDDLLLQPDKGVSAPACLSTGHLGDIVKAHRKWSDGVDGCTVFDSRRKADGFAGCSRFITRTQDGELTTILMGIRGADWTRDN